MEEGRCGVLCEGKWCGALRSVRGEGGSCVEMIEQKNSKVEVEGRQQEGQRQLKQLSTAPGL